MMNREKDQNDCQGKEYFQAKEEGTASSADIFISRASSAGASSRLWRSSKNPRIVCVSRYFGGKDRHSKVCTVKGLRDRRIRLSVPTAIQLYDLQERLGLGQPSKVVDWLMDVTKHEIDKLPPLQMPPGNDFVTQFHHQPLPVSSIFNSKESYMKGTESADQFFLPSTQHDQEMVGSSRVWNPAAEEVVLGDNSKGKWIRRDEEDHDEGAGIGSFMPQVSAQDLNSQSSFHGLGNNNMAYTSSCYQWEASNFGFSQSGSHGFSSQRLDSQNSGHHDVLPFSSMFLPSGSQLYPITTEALISPSMNISKSPNESDPGQLNQFQLLGSSPQHISPGSWTPSLHHLFSNFQMKSAFAYNVNSEALRSQEDIECLQQDQGNNGS